MSYTVRIERQAIKTLKALDKQTIRRIHTRLKELAVDPFDLRLSGQLEMGQGERNTRVGNWRVFF